jgi:trimeric autotransporter adhesin
MGTQLGGGTDGSIILGSAANSDTIQFLGASGIGNFGNGTDTAGTVNVSSATSANTISLDGAGATGTFGNADIAGTVHVTNAAGANIVALNGTGSSVIANGAAIYAGGTAAAGTGNNMIVDATSSRFVSSDSFSSAAVSDSSVVLTANDDGTANNRAQLNMAPTSATLFVNTDSGVSHGVDINQTRTVISGGTNSTSLTLDDDGATFRNDDTGGPAKVTGVADGTGDYDAVNYRQLKKYRDEAHAGIASVAALAAIPPPVPGKRVSIGGGYGNFRGSNAGAVGAKAILFDNAMLTAGVGIDDMSEVTTSVGFGWSF